MLFDIDALKHGCRLWTIVLEISILMAQFPSKEIAELSYDYRTLGLGYANIGTVLMLSGIPYDSEESPCDYRCCYSDYDWSLLYAVSAEMASNWVHLRRTRQNKEHMLRVIRNHRRAAYHAQRKSMKGL